MEYLPLIALLTVFSLITAVSLSALIGALFPKRVFKVNLVSVITKVSVGILLVLLGLGGYGITLAILSSQIVAFIISVISCLIILGFILPSFDDIVEITKIGFSNYPQILSTQLIVSAGIVLVALLTEGLAAASYYATREILPHSFASAIVWASIAAAAFPVVSLTL